VRRKAYSRISFGQSFIIPPFDVLEEILGAAWPCAKFSNQYSGFETSE
jgi:hypothetical protein